MGDPEVGWVNPGFITQVFSRADIGVLGDNWTQYSLTIPEATDLTLVREIRIEGGFADSAGWSFGIDEIYLEGPNP